MNKFDLEFMNRYIESPLRFARKIKKAQSLEEANRIATEMEEQALEKLDKTIAGL